MSRTRWALEAAPNPTVLRLHVDTELTNRTIVTCPPGDPPAVLAGLPEIDGVRSLDLHRYRARLNLMPGADAQAVAGDVTDLLRRALGEAEPLHDDEMPRAFGSMGRGGPRQVAESEEMAERAGDPRLTSVFRVEGVVEAVAAPGLVLVRLGRLFAWNDATTARVAAAVGDVDAAPL
ncbi:MAG: hypothetical protein OEW46_12715 [Actinomycetota bacterium]|nr:hypothetical protein [Actinomycetota bacterium]